MQTMCMVTRLGGISTQLDYFLNLSRAKKLALATTRAHYVGNFWNDLRFLQHFGACISAIFYMLVATLRQNNLATVTVCLHVVQKMCFCYDRSLLIEYVIFCHFGFQETCSFMLIWSDMSKIFSISFALSLKNKITISLSELFSLAMVHVLPAISFKNLA